MTSSIYITEESFPWLLETSELEQKNIISRLSPDSRVLLLSMIAGHYKEALVPTNMTPLLRENSTASKYRNLFISISKLLTSQELATLCQKQPDTDKQSLFIGALAQKVNEGDPDAFRFLCTVAEMPSRMEELRYSALTSLRMLPEKKIPKIRKMAQKSLGYIISHKGSSKQLRHTARSILDHLSGGSPRSSI